MGIKRPPDRLLEAMRVVRLEYKPVGRAVLKRVGRGVDDRVDQPARGSHERDRTVAERIELREPARLVATGHEHDVGGGLHQVREPLVESDDEIDRAWKGRSDAAERLLDMVVACAEHHKPRPSAAGQPAEQVDDEVDPLLIDQPAHESDQRPWVGRRMPKPDGERHAGRILAVGKVLLRVWPRDVAVGPRIPGDRVDAVDDSREHIAPRGEHALESTAAGSVLDLAGIGRTHRGEPIGEHNPGLEQVELAPKLHLLPVEVFPVESGEQHVPMPEEPLVGHVMDRHHGAGVLHRGRRGIEQLLVGGHEAGLPVVAVDDVVGHLLPRSEFHGGPRKKDEPLGVVGIVLRPAVERGAVEALVVGHEQRLDP